MTSFWIIAAAMVALALFFILPPVIRKGHKDSVSQDEMNTRIIDEKLADLGNDLVADKLEGTQLEDARSDLERELLDSLSAGENTPAGKPPRKGRWLAVLLIPAIPLGAVLLYQLLGAGDNPGLNQPGSAATNQAQAAAHELTLDEMAARLAKRLESQPENLQGWLMLANTYNALGRQADALKTYETAIKHHGKNNPDLLADYADMIVVTNGGDFTDETGALLARALELDPNHLKALWLAGHWRNQRGEVAEAIELLKKAAMQLPEDSEDRGIITRQIHQYAQQAGLSVDTAELDSIRVASGNEPPAATTAAVSDVSLEVQVSLAPDLASSATPDDTVFIFARAVEGSRMPLAVVRKQVKDLPVTVVLDDTLAMTPVMVLSKFSQVTVGARISKSGSAMPQSGDLQGFVSPVSTQPSGSVQITIDSRAP